MTINTIACAEINKTKQVFSYFENGEYSKSIRLYDSDIKGQVDKVRELAEMVDNYAETSFNENGHRATVETLNGYFSFLVIIVHFKRR